MQRRIAFRKALEEKTNDVIKNIILVNISSHLEEAVNEHKRNDQIKMENPKLLQHIEKVSGKEMQL